jgi:RNA polymerase sigma factor (sigma-70 family)
MAAVTDLATTITRLARQDRGRMLSALIAKFRNFDLAEEALQDALISAQEHWSQDGLPTNPQGWLVTVATRKILDGLRKSKRNQLAHADIALRSEEAMEEPSDIPDERLRLIFTCCHPVLEQKSQVALTLRTLGGLTTVEIAKAFLDNETTMGQRLSRAKTKISQAGIPFTVPEPNEWTKRLNAVLTVIYLVFNEGYFASQGETPLRQALCDEAIYLARIVNTLRPDEPEVLGLLALMLTTHARRRARLSRAGVVPLEAQDHMLWDTQLLKEADSLLDQAMAKRAPGAFQIQAAIAALHCQIGQRDWRQIVLLYDSLLRLDPNPVIRLNRAVALAELGQLEAALQEVGHLEEVLNDYQPFHAAKADLLAQAGRPAPALAAYEQAISMATNAADARFLTARRDQLISKTNITAHEAVNR